MTNEDDWSRSDMSKVGLTGDRKRRSRTADSYVVVASTLKRTKNDNGYGRDAIQDFTQLGIK